MTSTEEKEQLEFIVQQYFLNKKFNTDLDVSLLHDDLTLQNLVGETVAKNWDDYNVRSRFLKLLTIIESEDIINILNVTNNYLNVFRPDLSLDVKLKWVNLFKRHQISFKERSNIDEATFMFQIDTLTKKITDIFSKSPISSSLNKSNEINNENIKKINLSKNFKLVDVDSNDEHESNNDFNNVIKKERQLGLNIEKVKTDIRINTTEIANNIFNGIIVPIEVLNKLKENKKMLKAYFNTLALKLIVSEFKKETIFKDSLVFGINFLSPEEFMEFIDVLNTYYKKLSDENNTSENIISSKIDLFNKRWFVFIVNNKNLDPVLRNKITELLSEKIKQERSEENEKAINIISEMFTAKSYDSKIITDLRLESTEISKLFGIVFYKKILEIGIEMLQENEHYDNLVTFLVETLLFNNGTESLKIAIKEFRNQLKEADENSNFNENLDLSPESKIKIVNIIKTVLMSNPSILETSEIDSFIASIIDIITGVDEVDMDTYEDINSEEINYHDDSDMNDYDNEYNNIRYNKNYEEDDSIDTD